MKRFTFYLIVTTVITALQLNAQVSFDLKVYLEGPFNGTEMKTDLNVAGLIPLVQPYNVAPWNYTGTEQVTSIPNTDIVDWILVELRDAQNVENAFPSTAIARQAAFLNNTGNIVGLDGTSLLNFAITVNHNLYVVITHRNHMSVISAYSLIESGGIYSYDFTSSSDQALGGIDVQKELASNLWGLICGDGDNSGIIGPDDKTKIWKPQAGNRGYYSGDFNMNKNVNNVDKNDFWKPNIGRNSQLPWECGMFLCDTRDNQYYNTVQIGTQCWMAENLNIGTMVQGGEIMTDNSVFEKYCYNNEIDQCDVYGGLYQWDEMMQYTTQQSSEGICPDGWHIPSDFEWTTLTTFLGGDYIAGGKMKEAGTDHWFEPNAGATNESGFTVLPGGYCCFHPLGYTAHLWTSSQSDGSNGWNRKLYYDYTGVVRAQDYFSYGFSVRCVKNEPPSIPFNPIPSDGSVGQPVNSFLQWSCSHPQNSSLTYDVYFGTVNPPQPVSLDQSDAEYNPGILEINTLYYWKIIAHDMYGNITEGPVWSFMTGSQSAECGVPIIDTRDGQYYNTVQIGTQCWMAENLNIGIMIQGDETMVNDGFIEKFCYNNDPLNCNIYGGLYQWDEMMQYSTLEGSQGICLPGWHLPSSSEWTVLTDYLGGLDEAGGKMKETGLAHWADPNYATNESGFTALPGGRNDGGGFGYLTIIATYWTSTSEEKRELYHYGTHIYSGWYYNAAGQSVRCLKNNEPPTLPSNPLPSDGAINQPINTTLSWTCTDPDNDPLTYDVYFGTTNPPELIASGQTINSYSPMTLSYYTTYYWRIIATDNHNNSTEGPLLSFTTLLNPVWVPGEPFIDERDGQIYNTVVIGTQCWMKENLNIGFRIDGDNVQLNNGTIEKFCQGDIESNCNIYGGLYQWNEMMQYVTQQGTQGICPESWHLPTDMEYLTLRDFLGGENYAGGTMKTTGTLQAGTGLWYEPNTDATNASGFSGLPAGYYGIPGGFYNKTLNADFWCSTEDNVNNAKIWYLTHSNAYFTIQANNKYYGFSVRCLKNF